MNLNCLRDIVKNNKFETVVLNTSVSFEDNEPTHRLILDKRKLIKNLKINPSNISLSKVILKSLSSIWCREELYQHPFPKFRFRFLLLDPKLSYMDKESIELYLNINNFKECDLKIIR